MGSARRYLVTLADGSPVEVDLRFDVTTGLWTAEVGGEEFALRLLQTDDAGSVEIELDGEALDLHVHADADGTTLSAPGIADQLPVRAHCKGHLALSSRELPALPAPDPTVRSPITGVVHELKARVGDRVGNGDTIIVLEAMKMEIAIESPAEGTISGIDVAVGDRVRKDDRLFEIHLPDSDG